MIDFIKYAQFVDEVTSEESKSYPDFAARVHELEEDGIYVERLLTAAVGLCAESGEFTEVIKKMVFQGKPFNDDNREHLIIELGDLMWYVAQATQALGISMDEVLETNVNKLKKRYPGGEFDIHMSENRSADDR